MKRLLFVCTNRRLGATGCCAAGGAEDLLAALTAEVKRRKLGWQVTSSPCLAHCSTGPNVKAAGGPLLEGCRPENAAQIVDTLVAQWKP